MKENQSRNFIKNLFKRSDKEIYYKEMTSSTDSHLFDELNRKLSIYERQRNHFEKIAQSGAWEYYIDKDQFLCSDSFIELSGLPSINKISLDTLFKLIHAEDYEETYNTFEKACNGTDFSITFRIYHGNTNEIRYIQAQGEVLWMHNQPYKIIGVILDQTDKKLLEVQLKNTLHTYEHILNHINAAIWMKDFETNSINFISKKTEEIFEMDLNDIYSNDSVWESIIHPEDKEKVFQNQQLLRNKQTIYQQYRIQLPTGKVKWVYDQTIPYFNENDQLSKLFGVLVDITKEKQLQDELNYLATHDRLTTLPNQHYAMTKLEKLIKKKKPFGLLYFDIDRLSAINQALGYQTGDEVIKTLAQKLKHHAGFHFISRFNSNDFILIMDNLTYKEQAYDLSNQIIDSMQDPFTVNIYELIVTVSIGVSFFPDDADNSISLLEQAHKAMQKAKKLGKNNYQTLSNKETISSYKQFILERDMRKALQNNEFELYYQPVIHSKTGVIEGAEALIRWNHEDWGIVSPHDFIPLAIDNHLINQIGDWVIKQVIQQLATWKNENITLRPIAINITPARFYEKGFYDFLKNTLETHQIPAKYINLEINKHLVTEDNNSILQVLNQLKELGIKITVDDFGVGYSFLEFLLEFKCDTIKIDKTFTQHVSKADSTNQAIITSILNLAKELNIEVVAEGIETYEQYKFFKQKDCNLIQGFIFSKPVPLKTYEAMSNTGFLALPRPSSKKRPEKERRKYHRFAFHSSIIGEMHITKVNKKEIELAGTSVLIENISLEGIKLMSYLDLPIQSQLQFKFTFRLMNETFVFRGKFVWKEEAGGNIFYYGIHFYDIDEQQKDHLAKYLNKMAVLEKNKEKIEYTSFLDKSPFLFFDRIKKNVKNTN
ncbi:EAL domain-containing protein [Paraliobacillus salinarum]|uniref:EAL domain-containing protein n=1 Tax=Paraliobacillus salinarum TaxID=1158996 RepID=UPI0015F6A9F3|nr:EAL domain-containing protein [Paraliobacillus salinarum]